MTDNQLIIPKVVLTTSYDLASKLSTSRSYKEYIEEVEKTIRKNPRSLEATEVFLTTDNSNIINFEYSYLGTGAQQQGLRITIDFFDVDETFEKKIISRTMLDRFNYLSFFIAFGASPDLSNWTNFVVADLVTSEIFQDYNNPRTIRLNLVSTVGIQDLNSEIFNKSTRTIKDIADRLSLYLSEAVEVEIDEDKAKKGLIEPLNNGKEIAQIFKGYNYLDATFKRLVTNFLKAIFTEDQNILFLCEDIDVLLDRQTPNIPREYYNYGNYISTVKSSNSPRITIDSYNEALNISMRDYRPEATSFLEEATNFLTGPLTVAGAIRNYTDVLIEQFAQVCPVITVEAIISIAEFIMNTRLGIASVFNDDYERATEQIERIFLSINIPERAEKETDDEFSKKVSDVLQGIQSIFDFSLDTDSEQGILIRETDTRIIKFFLDYLKSEGHEDLIEEFKLSYNKPLLIFGQASVIQALLYGREFKSKKINSFNPFAKTYITDILESKIRDVNYKLYGSKTTNLLSPLQQALASTDAGNLLLQDQEKVAQNLVIFRHNIEDPNVLEMSVNDYKAYHSYLGIPRKPSPDSITPEEITLAQTYIRESIGGIRKQSILDELEAVATNTPKRDNEIRLYEDRSNYENLTFEDLNYSSEKIEDFISYLFKNRDFRVGLGKELGSRLVEAANSMKYEKSKKIKDDFDTLLLQLNRAYDKGLNSDTAIKLIGKDLLITREDYFTVLLKDLSSSMFRVTIKTLPFFFITGPIFIQEPCLLLSRRLKLAGSKNSELDSLLTGGYIIIGITHRITKDSAESEFILQKLQTPV